MVVVVIVEPIVLYCILTAILDVMLTVILTMIRGLTMTTTNHDDQLGEIYPTMLNELNCTFGVSFSRFHCCGRHGHSLWPSWYRPDDVTSVNK